MDNFLFDTVIEKVEGQGKRLDQNEILLTEMKEKVSAISDQSDNFKKLGEVVRQVQDKMNGIVWPVEKMDELSFRLKLNNDLLTSPVKTKTTVVHTGGILVWIIFFLSFVIMIIAIGLFETADKLNRYKTNDLLWRYVKVINRDQNLEYLHSVEKLYLKDPEKIKSQIEVGELRQKQLIEADANNEDPVSLDSARSIRKVKSKIKRSKLTP
jgi:hypothetical protein